jgi:hypothetical protein
MPARGRIATGREQAVEAWLLRLPDPGREGSSRCDIPPRAGVGTNFQRHKMTIS